MKFTIHQLGSLVEVLGIWDTDGWPAVFVMGLRNVEQHYDKNWRIFNTDCFIVVTNLFALRSL